MAWIRNRACSSSLGPGFSWRFRLVTHRRGRDPKSNARRHGLPLLSPCPPARHHISVSMSGSFKARHSRGTSLFSSLTPRSAPCSVTGYPQVFLVNAQGQQVGLTIKSTSGGWPDRPVTLSHAQTAEADLWQPDTTDVIEAGQPCSPIAWSAIRITFPAAVVVSGSSGEWSKATTTCGSGDVAPSITPLHVLSPSEVG